MLPHILFSYVFFLLIATLKNCTSGLSMKMDQSYRLFWSKLHSLMWYFMSHLTLENVDSLLCPDLPVVVQIWSLLCCVCYQEKKHYCTGDCMIYVTFVVSQKKAVKSEAWQGITHCPIPSAPPLFMQSTLPSQGFEVLSIFCWLW